MPGREFQRDRDRLATEVGCRGDAAEIAPPWVADELLASDGETRERLDIARVLRERDEGPALCLGRMLGPHLRIERSRSAGETLIGPERQTRSDGSSTACLSEEQETKLSGDPPGDFGLDQRKVFGLEFVPTRPEAHSRRRVCDPYANPLCP